MASLCHPWFTTTNLSYRFPIFETSATALCGTTGIPKIASWLYNPSGGGLVYHGDLTILFPPQLRPRTSTTCSRTRPPAPTCSAPPPPGVAPRPCRRAAAASGATRRRHGPWRPTGQPVTRRRGNREATRWDQGMMVDGNMLEKDSQGWFDIYMCVYIYIYYIHYLRESKII